MKKYCVYMTIYLGNLLPPFYIGSAISQNIEKGYHGSVCSAEWGKIWKTEIKNNPHLFKTYVIPGSYVDSLEEKLNLENQWQHQFDVVRNDSFINKSFAHGKLYNTPASIAKGLETRRSNGKDKHTDEAKEKCRLANTGRKKSIESKRKMSMSKKGKPSWNKGMTQLPPSAKASKCIFVDELGNKYEYESVRRGCIAHNLPTSKMSHVTTKKLTHYKGWTIEIL